MLPGCEEHLFGSMASILTKTAPTLNSMGEKEKWHKEAF